MPRTGSQTEAHHHNRRSQKSLQRCSGAFGSSFPFSTPLFVEPRRYQRAGYRKTYLRKILIHGAHAVVLRSKRDRIAMGAWMSSLETRAPRNVLIVATAHKLARIAWAVLSTGQDYRAVPEALTV